MSSLAVEPQYPQLCIRHSDSDMPVMWSSQSGGMNPMELSAVLNSLPCSLSFTADDHLPVIQTLVALVCTSSSSSSSSSILKKFRINQNEPSHFSHPHFLQTSLWICSFSVSCLVYNFCSALQEMGGLYKKKHFVMENF